MTTALSVMAAAFMTSMTAALVITMAMAFVFPVMFMMAAHCIRIIIEITGQERLYLSVSIPAGSRK